MAIKPARWPARKDVRAVLARTWKEAGEDNVSFLAAAVAFCAFLAFVPLLASLVLLYGLVVEPASVAAMGWVEALLPHLPGWAHGLLQLVSWVVAVAALGPAAFYRFAPNRPDAPWVWVSPRSAGPGGSRSRRRIAPLGGGGDRACFAALAAGCCARHSRGLMSSRNGIVPTAARVASPW
jgi:uncharacterized BrkB/YihY/UPF0761 family membrane protein